MAGAHLGAGIARWWCVGLAVLLDAASWVRSSSEENFSNKWDFSLGVITPTSRSDSIPQKTLSDESINQGLVCVHVYSISQTQKILTFVSLTGECQQQKHQACTIRNVTTSMVRLENGHIRKNLTPNGEPQRSSWGTQKNRDFTVV